MAFQGGAFQPGAFQTGGFQAVEALVSSINVQRIPRWLLHFKRTGHEVFLSDVGGDVEDQQYQPVTMSVEPSDLTANLEEMSFPVPSVSVSLVTAGVFESFVDPEELQRSRVKVSAWDGYSAYVVAEGRVEDFHVGYDGELVTFKVTEDFRRRPNFPPISVDVPKRFTRAEVVESAEDRVGTWVFGNAFEVPAFALRSNGTVRYLIAYHNTPTLPTGDGTPARFHDLKGATYIGVELVDESQDVTYNFSAAQRIHDAGKLVRRLVRRFAEYPLDQIDQASFRILVDRLRQYKPAGYFNTEQPIFDWFEQRLQKQFLFMLFEEGGVLKGFAVDPTLEPERHLVYGIHMLQLEEPVFYPPKFTRFRVRFKYSSVKSRFLRRKILNPDNSEYLRALEDGFGRRRFPRLDLPDVRSKGTARKIVNFLANIFHRAEEPSYLQFASYSEIPFGTVVALTDSERGYDERPAILIGRKWLTPEFLVHRFRTIEPYGESLAAEAAASGDVITPSEPPPEPDPDGPPIEGSEIPTFGDGSGDEEQNSCFTDPGAGGSFSDRPHNPGTKALINTSVIGSPVTVETSTTCECSFVAPENGNIRAGAIWAYQTIDVDGGFFNPVFTVTVNIWSDENCTTLVHTDSNSVSASGAGNTDAIDFCLNTDAEAISAGQRVTVRFTMADSSDFTEGSASQWMEGPWLSFSTTVAPILC
jgi:hypothetical protein